MKYKCLIWKYIKVMYFVSCNEGYVSNSHIPAQLQNGTV